MIPGPAPSPFGSAVSPSGAGPLAPGPLARVGGNPYLFEEKKIKGEFDPVNTLT